MIFTGWNHQDQNVLKESWVKADISVTSLPCKGAKDDCRWFLLLSVPGM